MNDSERDATQKAETATNAATPATEFQKFKLLDLFSGIGGFSLGLERSGGFETVAFCEIDPFCRKVLAKHWPKVPCYEDVRTLTAARLADDGISVNAICGGFPCQDVSQSGHGAGLSGARSGLWSEIVRLACELRPRVVVVENVTGLLTGDGGNWFSQVLGDLAASGFDAEWRCISAAEIGAEHKRDRIWIVAYADEKLRGSLVESIEIQPSIEFAQSLAEGRIHRPPSVSVPLGRVFTDPSGGDVRNDNGIPEALDRIGSLGNAVVPQIPELIGRAIMESMK